MKVVYVAGKYRDTDAYLIWQHINRARELSVAVWRLGAVALCPHMNSMFMEGAASAQDFIDGTLELMKRCDAVLVTPGYESSVGTRGEIEEAVKMGKPVFYHLWELQSWLQSTCSSAPPVTKSG